MSDWKTTRISDFCEITRGGSPRPIQDYIASTGTPWVKIADATTSPSRYISETKEYIRIEGENKSRVVFPGDLILSNSATPGLPRFMKIRACIHDGWLLLRDIKGVDKLFLYYLLLNEREALIALGNGSIFTNLKTEILKNHIVKIPPLSEQKAIAGVLSSLDDKIDLLHRQNKTLEAMAETIFRQWFIEEAEDDWDEVPLHQVIDYLEGPGIRNWQYTDSGVPFINIRLINNNDIDISKANYVSEEEGNIKYAHFHLQDKDLVMSTSGTLGRTAIVRPYHLPMILNTSVIRFRPKAPLGYAYMYQYLNSMQFLEELLAYACGSVQLNFGPTHLRKIYITLPPLERFKQYDLNAKPLYDKVANNQSQIKSLEKIRSTLLPKLMSGEVRVEFK